MDFKWLTVLCVVMGFINVAKAQIYESEICYYANTENSNDMYQVKFMGRTMRLSSHSSSEVRTNLKKSDQYYIEYLDDKCENKEYCSGKSTSSREVYRGHRMVQRLGVMGYTEGEGWKYFAFSTDKSSLIVWEEIPTNYDGTIQKKYYVRVSKEDLLPKAINYDFLND